MPRRMPKAPVGERALRVRLRRKLEAEGQGLRKSRWRQIAKLGEYYVIDVRRGSVLSANIDLEALARERGVLRSWEELAHDDGE